MFRDIVVPLDGSSLAERAIGLAGWIADECDARLHLVRVRLSPADRSAHDDAVTAAADERYLRGLASSRRDGVRDVRVAVLDGSVALAISDYADRINADLIVMTTHGRTGDERRRLGSVAAVVMHHAPCPVMLVRGGGDTVSAPRVPFEHIVIAVDGTEQRDAVESIVVHLGRIGHPAFRIVHTLAPATAPELVPAAADAEAFVDGCMRPEHTAAEAHVSGIANRLRALGMRAEVLVAVTESPAHAIGAVARHEAADLVVVVSRLDAPSPALRPSVAEALLQEWSSPVLLVKQP